MRRCCFTRCVVPLSAALLFVLSVAGPAGGQIDYRVNQSNNAGGHALDANPAVGSNGINLSRPGFDAGFGSNAIVTGNVSGLARFQALSPVPQTNAFRADLPSASLSNFQRQSFGLNTLSPASAPNQPQFFFDPQITVADVAQIVRNQNVPGSSRLISPYTPPVSPASPQQSAPFPVSIPQTAAMETGAPPVQPTNFGITQRDMTGAVIRPETSPYDLASSSSIFGVRPPVAENDMQALINRLQTRNRGMVDGRVQTTMRPDDPRLRPGAVGNVGPIDPLTDTRPLEQRVAAPGETDLRADRRINEIAGLDTNGIPRFAGQDRPTGPQYGITQRDLGRLSEAVPLDRLMTGQTPANLGDDRFADLYNAVRVAQAAGVQQVPFDRLSGLREREVDDRPESGGGITMQPGMRGLYDRQERPADDDAMRPVMPPRPGDRLDEGVEAGERFPADRRARDDGVRQLAAAARWASDVLNDPVTTFVGRYESQLNEYLALAEATIRDGQFYDAAGYYELAHTIDPQNPLPLLGRGHALAAAGDYASAVAALERGIARFPHIAVFQMDLTALAGGKDVFDVRRADLERQLASVESHELRFLLGYLELYSGLPEDGLRDLQKAAESAPPGSAIATFPDLLMGERPLPDLDAK